MKNVFFAILAILFIATSCQKKEVVVQQEDLVQFINPLVGSDSDYKLSTGNTYPATAVPWGMNFWTPQTGGWSGWLYQYKADHFRGIQQCHQPSPWIGNYASFTILPVTDELKVLEEERQVKFSHDKEISQAHYYKVALENGTSMEVTPTERAAIFNITYAEGKKPYLVLDGNARGNHVKIDTKNNTITGYVSNNNGGVPENFKNYFIFKFDQPFKSYGTWTKDGIKANDAEATNEHCGAYVEFAAGTKLVVAKVASSFISLEQAQLNLSREIGDKNFAQIKDAAQAKWNKELNRIQVKGGTDKEKRNFYTSLYRTMLFPRTLWEVDANNKIVHYSPYNGEVLPGYMYTDNGFWDTFRAVFPFFTVMYRDLNAQIMEGLANTYKESGWLPEWASPGHRSCMIGSNSASLIADSYLRGIRGYDINTLYEAIIKNSNNPGPLASVGRAGAKEYNKLGYVPCDIKINESAARTLEYAYADYCIWKLAIALNRPQEEIDRFKKRAQNYHNLFDKDVKFMRGKKANGEWLENFDEFAWGGVFTEGSSWHYTWSVFQDPQGLIDLMGGQDKFLEKMDAIFSTPAKATWDYYGHKIHEILEMELCGMGQYAHGNQPIQHAIYLYNWAGQPWKAQKWARTTMDKLYAPTPDGLCGDEDNGQTSAWYVFSAMGMYPVCPGSGEYAIGSPVFDEVKLHLENGKTFTIEAANQGAKNIYIKDASLNGTPFTKNYFTYDELMNGGTVKYTMSETPNKERGTKPSDFPYSMSNEK
ncbi:glycoside hydrolase family 92 protein [Prolixibacteraceae bacterium JC049]|nr:glycoside hydrolase family 92 protein [Prolixibacteraceae bacterium JC049]